MPYLPETVGKLVRSDKVTGTSTEGREELATLLQFLREGDTLVVTRIDRLARSLRDLQNIVHDLRPSRSRLPNSQSTHPERPGNASWICLGCSQSSKPIGDASGRWKVS